MLRFPSLTSRINFRSARGGAGATVFCLSAVLLALSPLANGQDFTISMAAFTPFAVDPGGTSSSNLTLVAGTGFTGTVSLSCAITSNLTNPTAPGCLVSPTTVTPSGGATATITTSATPLSATNTIPPTTPGAYTVTITAVGPSTTHSVGQTITVLAVNPAFTITIADAVLPNTVKPGSGGIGTININPVFGYGNNSITMSCASVTPLVTVPPVCQFSPNPVPVTASVTTQTTISVVTYGPIPTTSAAHPRVFYALWLPLPLLAFAGVGAAMSGKRARKAWAVLALFILSGSLLLLPACGNNSTPTTVTPNGITPNGTYTFTLQGVDQNGNISTNTNTGSAPTVTLTVN
jgi:hypothetical protein